MDRTATLQRLLHLLKRSKWTLLTGIATVAIVFAWQRNLKTAEKKRLENAEASDPGLVRKHTRYESFTTKSGFTYPRIRVFYKEHGNAAKLPKDLPLLVFTHGLGGSASQFAPLLTNVINLAPCLAIDLPGCGLSQFAPKNRKAYTTHALAELVAAAIARFRDVENDQKVVLVGHSMGCSINALLASSTSPLSHFGEDCIIGMIAICPKGTAFNQRESSAVRRLAWLPIPIFDLLRWYDRQGGMRSASVTRVLGPDAGDEARKLQMKYNEQSQSGVFLYMVQAGVGQDGLPGLEVWSGVKVPLFLVGGEGDNITPAYEVERITTWLTTQHEHDIETRPSNDTLSAPTPVPTTTSDTAAVENKITPSKTKPATPRTDSGRAIKDDHTSTKHSFALKTTIFPPPASHGLLYTSTTVHILSGMMEGFLANHVDERLGGAWQLRHMTTSGKWDVKNLEKWRSVDPCSEPIGRIFRAMKTMREVDDEHSPKEFVKRFSSAVIPDGVAIVLDISHESPVYHPKSLEDAGVEYHKFPTVSKQKPQTAEIEQFLAIVDKLRQSPKLQPTADGAQPTLAVHCHYGFNRTGVFLVCYMVEKLGYKLEDAIEEFRQKRPPGIKHQYFVNDLYVRYAVKMERRGTVVA